MTSPNKLSMNLVTLSGITRNSGGVFYAVNSLCRVMKQHISTINVIGRYDRLSKNDIDFWDPIPVHPYKSFGPIKSSFQLRGLLNQFPVDLIHLHGIWLNDQRACLHWQKRTGKPVIISPHGMLDSWALENSFWKKKLIGKLFANRSLTNANCIHALCKSEADSIRAYGLKNPIVIIPNGIDIPKSNETLLPPWKAKKNTKTLLFIGRLHPKKGLNEMLEAINLLKQEDSLGNWEIKIAGWSQLKHEQELKNFCLRNSLNRFVEFIGPVFDGKKVAAFQNADAFILPSHSEGLPMTILEAWSYRLPVIMTSYCNLPEGFDANAAVHINTDPKNIASQLKSFFNLSVCEQKRIGVNGLELVKTHFTWDKIANDMIATYKWILDKGPKPEFVIEDK
ncbi:glycosyltransferase [uncultured Draconibacterium sp.]|uniref:glycosyltransferase n=1 Tax=uncultured Draconibacterium sp. TaxID=1573823 RepID=UPI003260D5B6